MKMISKRIILMPLGYPLDWKSIDYNKQTALLLAKKNVVICFDENSAPFKNFFIPEKRKPILKKISSNFFLYQKTRLIPFEHFKIVQRLNIFLEKKLLLLIIKYFEITRRFQKKILWIFEPQFYFIVKEFKKLHSLTVLFDCVDYSSGPLLSLDNLDSWFESLRDNETRLIKESDFVFVNSRTLYQLHKNTRKEITVVPQGFRSNFFAEKLAQRKHHIPPIIGYVGGINTRIDYELIGRLARKRPEWLFKLVGPIQGSENDILNYTTPQVMKLKQLKNITFEPPVPVEQMSTVIQQFDICMIPYDVRQSFNRYCYPMKIFEYFFLGKPVVSTRIEELNYFPNLVYLGNTASEWEKNILKLLSKPWPLKLREKQRELSLSNSWEKKLEAISRTIEERGA